MPICFACVKNLYTFFFLGFFLMIIGSASVWNMNKKKMCKKSEASERNVQEEQKFSTCMICLDVNESLEEVALRKNQTTF
jgi:hypothetical protein